MMSRMQTKLFNAIIRECKRGRRLAHFSTYVRYRLEQYERKMRKEIVSRKSDNCAPLFYACATRNVKMVEYLVSTCGANVDQTGRWNPHVGGTVVHDFEMTPLQRACHKAKNYRFGVVRCLVKHGADIDPADDLFGRTCLMEAVGNVKMCEFLLKNGADVEARDVGDWTALDYAINKNNIETVKLLLDYGADVILRWHDNDDVLEPDQFQGFLSILNYLAEHGLYSPGSLADANEVMGSRCFYDTQGQLRYWRKAIEIRNANAVDGKPLAKTPSMPKRDCYRNASEFTSLDELDAIALDEDALTIQRLLIHERILGEHHRATFDALDRTGAAYAETLRYQDCLDFWRRALETSVDNDSILWSDVGDVAEGLVRALYNLHEQIPLEEADPNRVNKEQYRFADDVAIFKLLTNRLVTAEPPFGEIVKVYSNESHGYDAILKCVTHLIDLLVKTARTSEAKDEVRALVRQVVNQNPKSLRTHDTLLHLCVSSDNSIVSEYFPYDHAQFFPNLEVTKLLLECEADVNARNEDGKTPLFTASCPGIFSYEIVKLLLDHGAHSDTPDKWGATPAYHISRQPSNTVDLMNYTTLRCLAARAIVRNEIQYHNFPASVNQFLDLHRRSKLNQQY